jgi:hypothetical protein
MSSRTRDGEHCDPAMVSNVMCAVDYTVALTQLIIYAAYSGDHKCVAGHNLPCLGAQHGKNELTPPCLFLVGRAQSYRDTG